MKKEEICFIFLLPDLTTLSERNCLFVLKKGLNSQIQNLKRLNRLSCILNTSSFPLITSP